MFGTTSFIFFSTPNWSACLVEATASAPKATLTKTSAPLLAMFSSAELKSVVPQRNQLLGCHRPAVLLRRTRRTESNTEWP